ncbi:MAG: hypothetical protein L0Y60_12270, partial [Beijerinckiaceae bacterium]|nr:hypothetical protein [Beijerinckiaceae bacterium]
MSETAEPAEERPRAGLARLLRAPEPVSFAKAGGALMNLSGKPSLNLVQSSRAATVLLHLRALFVVAALGAGVSGCGYNTIPTFEEQAKAKWGDVQNQYQRRADLIP